MNCLYCQKELKDISITNPTSKPATVVKSHCEECHATFRRDLNNKMIYINWDNILLKEKLYSVKLLPDPDGLQKFIVYYLGILDANATIHRWQEIMNFDFIPETWTPQNITSKLKTYLPFI